MPNLTSVAELLDIEQQLGSSRSMKMPRIVLYQYPGSPWGAKVAFYLALRGIAYSECHQPMTWPRPDLEPLGIRYRRIPIMAIGRDIYYDSSLIFDKLEVLYAENRMGATKPSEQALEKLTERWVETCVLPSVFSLLPTELPFVKDEKFLQDRMTLWGEDMSAKAISSGRSRSLVEMQGHFAFLERLLQDGRTWLQDTPEPSLTDIHGTYDSYSRHPRPEAHQLAYSRLSDRLAFENAGRLAKQFLPYRCLSAHVGLAWKVPKYTCGVPRQNRGANSTRRTRCSKADSGIRFWRASGHDLCHDWGGGGSHRAEEGAVGCRLSK